MTDREKIEAAIVVVKQSLEINGISAKLACVVLEPLEIGRKAILDGWERQSKCRQ